MEKNNFQSDGDIAAEERAYVGHTRSLRSLYQAKVKALDAILELLEKGVREKLPLSGIAPLKAALSWLEDHPGKQSYSKLVAMLVSQGCCDDTKFPSRSVAAGLKKGIRDGQLMADNAENPQQVWTRHK